MASHLPLARTGPNPNPNHRSKPPTKGWLNVVWAEGELRLDGTPEPGTSDSAPGKSQHSRGIPTKGCGGMLFESTVERARFPPPLEEEASTTWEQLCDSHTKATSW